MSKKTTITCDQCSEELSSSDHRIELSYFWSRHATMPPPEPTYHFCGKECFVKWVTSEYAKSSLNLS